MKYGYMVSGGAHDEVCVRTGTVDALTAREAAARAFDKHQSRRLFRWKAFGRLFGSEKPVCRFESPGPAKSFMAGTEAQLVSWDIQDDGHADRVWVAAQVDGDGVRRLLPMARAQHKAGNQLDRMISNMPHARNRC